MKFRYLFAGAALVAGCATSTKTAMPRTPSSDNAAAAAAPLRRAIIIGLDGATGAQVHEQAWTRQQAPALLQLMKDGKFATCVQARDPRCARAHSGPNAGPGYRWLTGPGWASVLTGVDNGKLQIKNNTPAALSEFSKSSQDYPSFLMRIHRELGFKVAAGGVGAFMTSLNHGVVKAGVLDYECGTTDKNSPIISPLATSSCNVQDRHAGDGDDPERDRKLVDWMKTRIEDPDSRVIMGVLDQIDAEGHRHGFSSNPNYLQAISQADTLVGEMTALIRQRALEQNEEWLVIVTSDHGGHQVFLFGTHGTHEFTDSAVPFVVTTYGTAAGPLNDLQAPVSHMDVHATVMHWFGKESPHIEGRVQALL